MDEWTISVVVPAYNEEDVLEEFHARLSGVLATLSFNSEILYVNDGSHDRTLFILRKLQLQDPRIGIIDLSRNFGKEAALTAGLHRACGDAVVVIDSDLQDPPELIPEFIRVWQHGEVHVVYGQREKRDGETWLKKTTASAFYQLMQHFGRTKLPLNTGDFRLLDRKAVEALKALPEQHRFMKGLFTWIGFDQRAVPYTRDPRKAGETKWSYWRLWNFAIEGLTSYTIAPLQVAIYAGLFISFFSFLYGVFIITRTMLRGGDVAGYPSLIVVILFLGGIQLLFIGILGEYLGRIFNETKRRPLYFEKSYTPSFTESRSRPSSDTSDTADLVRGPTASDSQNHMVTGQPHRTDPGHDV